MGAGGAGCAVLTVLPWVALVAFVTLIALGQHQVQNALATALSDAGRSGAAAGHTTNAHGVERVVPGIEHGIGKLIQYRLVGVTMPGGGVGGHGSFGGCEIGGQRLALVACISGGRGLAQGQALANLHIGRAAPAPGEVGVHRYIDLTRLTGAWESTLAGVFLHIVHKAGQLAGGHLAARVQGGHTPGLAHLTALDLRIVGHIAKAHLTLGHTMRVASRRHMFAQTAHSLCQLAESGGQLLATGKQLQAGGFGVGGNLVVGSHVGHVTKLHLRLGHCVGIGLV